MITAQTLISGYLSASALIAKCGGRARSCNSSGLTRNCADLLRKTAGRRLTSWLTLTQAPLPLTARTLELTAPMKTALHPSWTEVSRESIYIKFCRRVIYEEFCSLTHELFFFVSGEKRDMIPLNDIGPGQQISFRFLLFLGGFVPPQD